MPDTPLNFQDWLQERLRQVRYLSGVLTLLFTLLLSTIGGVPDSANALKTYVPLSLNIAVIMFFFVQMLRSATSAPEGGRVVASSPAKSAVFTLWVTIMVLWVAMYVTLAVQRGAVQGGNLGWIMTQVVYMLNAVNSAYIFLVFMMLTKPARALHSRHWQVAVWVVALALSSFSAALDLKGYSHDVLYWLTLTSSVFGSIALVSLAGRLDDPEISLPGWSTLALYSYGAIQPLFWICGLSHAGMLPSAPDSDALKYIAVTDNLVTFLAFVLKFLLCAIIYWFFKEGVVDNYLNARTGGINQVIAQRAHVPRELASSPAAPSVSLSYMESPSTALLQEVHRLLSARLPRDEVVSYSDFQQMVEEAEQLELGGSEPTTERFLVARDTQGVCGFVYTIFCRRYKQMFVSYLVTSRRVPAKNSGIVDSDQRISRLLVDEVIAYAAAHYGDCNGILMEVDHPGVVKKPNRAQAKARLAVFGGIASTVGVEFQLMDFGYCQPRLPEVAASSAEPAMGPAMILAIARPPGLAQKTPEALEALPLGEMADILSFIAESVYGRFNRNRPELRRGYLVELSKWHAEMLGKIGPVTPLRRSHAQLTAYKA